MDFRPDETVQAVTTLAADVFRREADRADTPWVWPDTDPAWDETCWKAMADAGLLGLAVPAEFGGDGLGVLEIAAVLTEVGRYTAAVPALATLALGVLPLRTFGTPGQCARWLPGVASGADVFTAGTREPSAALGAQPAVLATADGVDFRLTGTVLGVPHAAAARRILVPARITCGPDDTGTGVLLVDPAADGVDLVRTPTSSGAPEYTVRLRAAPGELLGTDHSGRTLAGLYEFAAAGACATAAGVLDGALALTAEHVRTREQFGRPLSTFQAVAQEVAEVYTTARTLRLVTQSACWRLATGREAGGDLAVAMHWLADEALPALHRCQHLHGGVGVDVSYPLHRYYGWTRDLARFVGGSAATLDRLGARIAG